MADDADENPSIGADTGGFPAYHSGSGPAFGIPEEAFPVETWTQRLERNRPLAPGADPDIFRKPDQTGIDATSEKSIPRWNKPIKDRYT